VPLERTNGATRRINSSITISIFYRIVGVRAARRAR